LPVIAVGYNIHGGPVDGVPIRHFTLSFRQNSLIFGAKLHLLPNSGLH